MPTPARQSAVEARSALRLRWLRWAGLLLVLAALILGGLAAEEKLRRQIEPDLTGLAQLIADDLALQVTRAVDAGIPPEHLVGMPDFFDAALVADERVRAAALIDASGTLLYSYDPDGLLTGIAAAIAPGDGTWTEGRRVIVSQPLAPLDVDVAADAPAPRLLVAARVELLDGSWAGLWSGLLLLGIVLTIAGALLFNALLDLIWYQPRALLRTAAQALEDGDFALHLPAAPGALGRVTALVERQLKATNAAYLALRLAAFGTRSGNFDPAVLSALRSAEREAIEGLRFSADYGTRRLQAPEGGLAAAAAFLLMLPEAMLVGAGAAIGLASLGALLAVLAGTCLVLLLRRAVSALLSRQLAYAFGALLAAFGILLAAVIPDAVTWLARLGSGVGYGLAFLAVCRSRSGAAGVGAALLAALACGLAAGLFLEATLAADFGLALGGERGFAAVAALLLVLAALLGGLTLRPTEGDADDSSQMPLGAWAGLLCAGVAGLLILPAFVAAAPGGAQTFAATPPLLLALAVAWAFFGLLTGSRGAARRLGDRAVVVGPVLAAAVLGVAAFGGVLGLDPGVGRWALAISVALLLGVPLLHAVGRAPVETSLALSPLAFIIGLVVAAAVSALPAELDGVAAGLPVAALVLVLIAAALGLRSGGLAPPLAERAS